MAARTESAAVDDPEIASGGQPVQRAGEQSRFDESPEPAGENVRGDPLSCHREALASRQTVANHKRKGPHVLRQVAEGVLIHQSEFCQSNAVVVQGRSGVLLIDPGVLGQEMVSLADDLRELGQPVVAGFSTHPHWDHLLWHARLGPAPRYGTARCAAVRDRLSDPRAKARIAAELIPPGIAGQVPLDLLGLITGLPAETARIPWDGPQVRIIEHQAHAAGHAALLIEERGVLVAGDMLSDVLIPMLDLNGGADPIEDYLAALRLLEGAAVEVDVLVPGHGSVGGAGQARARIDQDRAYVRGLRDAHGPSDPRVGPSAKEGWDWVAGVHARQLQHLAQTSDRDGAPG
jgi:glyoxylase-like metal-dependent hydrolase (beta-lactamase superfamily II)